MPAKPTTIPIDVDFVWGGSIRAEYLEFAVALLLFLVLLIGAYWFVISEPGTREGRQPKKKRRSPERITVR